MIWRLSRVAGIVERIFERTATGIASWQMEVDPINPFVPMPVVFRALLSMSRTRSR